MTSRKRRESQKGSPGKPASNSRGNNKTRKVSIRPYRPSRKKAFNPARVTPRSASWTILRFNALSPEKQDVYFRSKHILHDIRDGKTASEAARDNGTTIATARRYFPADFFKEKGSNRWSVSSSDKHVNQVVWIGLEGSEIRLLRGSKEASRLGRYISDVVKAVRGDESQIKKWRGVKIGGRKLITDIKLLTKLGADGKLDFDDEIRWRS